jgi:hypothetical protein
LAVKATAATEKTPADSGEAIGFRHSLRNGFDETNEETMNRPSQFAFESFVED